MLTNRGVAWLSLATSASLAASTSLTPPAASEPQWTFQHEAGRCALRGQCGKQGFFGGDLPCPDNGFAEDPTQDVRDKLVSICGDEWRDGKVCCQEDQLDVLKSNLDKANSILSSCGACRKNFYDLFCTFTCSPDQSLFVNVTDTALKGDKFLVTELDHLVSEGFGTGFYNSCKDVKFGATGGRAMDFIGGGAKNYSQMLKFLGDKKPFLGSPFQINFPATRDDFPAGMHPILQGAIPCNSTEEKLRCACVDCEAACPALPQVEEAQQCHVGLLPCLSFAIVIIYSVFITLLVLAVSGHAAAAKRRRNNNERLQLLQDASPSDDEDEGHMVHSAGMLDRPTKQYAVNTYCDRIFSKLGLVCARFPAITVVSSVALVGLLCIGWTRFEIETDPVKLWVSPDSAAAAEKQFFDDNFGPFFRAEQAFLVNDTLPEGPGPVLSYNTLAWWFDVERRIRVQKSLGHGYTLEDVCYNPTGEGCVVQSVSGWFTSTGLDQDNWEGQINKCASSPGDTDCLPLFKLPLPSERLLGGFNRSSEPATNATALVTTWVIKNFNAGEPELEQAEEWEDSMERLLKDIQGEAIERGLRLSYSTEISLEQELNKNTNTDAKIVIISYIVMFIYASLALGSTTVTLGTILRNPIAALVQSKFMLGIVGIVIVLMSVAASVGLFAAAGVKATLIIAEVIPFLVLAVGVDNIFLIVHEFERVNVSHADEPVPERVARALGRMGPSILLSASTETVAFSLGAAVGMPAVRNFAAYAAGAVFINALLQVTMFISILSLNQQRVEDSRLDCIPCLQVQPSRMHHMANGYGGASFTGAEEEGSLSRFIRKHYAPALLGNKVRVAIITIFLGFFAAGIALLPEVPLGLEQRIAIPSDSYLIDYFNDLDAYFEQGAPVYFVVKDLNVTARAHQQELCARYTTCNEFSLANILEQERKRPEVSYIADATASWVDDFFQWLNPDAGECCVDGSKACLGDRQPPWNNALRGMPEGREFVSYAKRWLNSPSGAECPYAGQAPYGDAVVIDETKMTVPASHFRTAHVALTSQEDFINAYASARRIAQEISQRNNIEVFPYSKFYIFFDQYASIVQLSTALVGAALAFIFVITSILIGSLLTSAIVTFTVIMIVVDIVGTMALSGVSLNAVSLVNIIISVGIGVEFCAHIARAFTIPSASILDRAQNRFRGKDARALAALVNVGGSVFSGITITKLLGVFVLAFTRSKIFEIYYFRVWLALVVWAALHALVFLPVALSLFGGKGYRDPESDGGLEQDLASRRYRALLPDDEYSDDGF